MNEEDNGKGLERRYQVRLADGSEIPDESTVFVLRIDTDPTARLALAEYARRTPHQKLAADLRDLLLRHGAPASEDMVGCHGCAKEFPESVIEECIGCGYATCGACLRSNLCGYCLDGDDYE